MVLGLGFTRIGCFLAGCCHGEKTDLPWGVVFPQGSQASRVFTGNTAPSPPVHPTQLYESALGFALVPLAIYLLKRRKFTGQTFLILIVCYAVGRFLLEFIRADDDRGTVLGILSTSQFIGLVLVPLAIGLYLWRRKTAPPPPEWLSKEQVQQSLIEQGVIKPDDKAESDPDAADSGQRPAAAGETGKAAKSAKSSKNKNKKGGKRGGKKGEKGRRR
jgi:prolipoprotein diacylglyceryltransferase